MGHDPFRIVNPGRRSCLACPGLACHRAFGPSLVALSPLRPRRGATRPTLGCSFSSPFVPVRDGFSDFRTDGPWNGPLCFPSGSLFRPNHSLSSSSGSHFGSRRRLCGSSGAPLSPNETRSASSGSRGGSVWDSDGGAGDEASWPGGPICEGRGGSANGAVHTSPGQRPGDRVAENRQP